ncbi:SsrA-binding protein SmpB [candidate division KSB1 bacterium]
MNKEDIQKVYTVNKKAWHDYHILNKYEAGIILLGSEVKAVREGNINLKDSYAFIRKGEIFLTNVHIGPYKPASKYNHQPERERKLLLNRREINKISGKLLEKGLTLVPLKVYALGGFIKVELGVGRGKRSYDKREAIAKKDQQRDQERMLKYK